MVYMFLQYKDHGTNSTVTSCVENCCKLLLKNGSSLFIIFIPLALTFVNAVKVMFGVAFHGIKCVMIYLNSQIRCPFLFSTNNIDSNV